MSWVTAGTLVRGVLAAVLRPIRQTIVLINLAFDFNVMISPLLELLFATTKLHNLGSVPLSL